MAALSGRFLRLYGWLRLVLVVLVSLVTMFSLYYYYARWSPSGLEALIRSLQVAGYSVDPGDPYSVIRATREAAPQLLGKLDKIVAMAPYDAINFRLGFLASGLSALLHSLVLFYAIMYTSVLSELFSSGVYAVMAALRGSRGRILAEFTTGQALFYIVLGFVALSPIFLAPYINAWIDVRRAKPSLFIGAVSLGLFAVELLLYMLLGAVFAYYGRFTEYVIVAATLLLVLPFIVVDILATHVTETLGEIIFTLLMILRPINAEPGVTAYTLASTSIDPEAKPLVTVDLPVKLSILGVILAIVAIAVTAIYLRYILEKKGVP